MENRKHTIIRILYCIGSGIYHSKVDCDKLKVNTINPRVVKKPQQTTKITRQRIMVHKCTKEIKWIHKNI